MTITLGNSVNLIFIAVVNEPRTYHKALCSLYSSKQEHTIESKYTQLLKSDIFEQMNELLAGKKAVESHIVFKKKLDEHGNYVKFKVHIVAKDFSQVPSKNFSENFSFVAKFTTLQVFLALTVYLDFNIHQFNIITVYLQDNLDEEIYITILDKISEFGLGKKLVTAQSIIWSQTGKMTIVIATTSHKDQQRHK